MYNILVVDDMPDNLRLLGAILREHQYEVRLASEGEFALQSAIETPPDLILLDIKMPGMDGYDVCQALKVDERTRDIPVIFISALSDLTNKVKGFEVGGVDYITKPFQAEEVLVRLRTHLFSQSMHKRLQEQNAQLQKEIAWHNQAEEELRLLNQQVSAANQELHEANTRKDKFFSIIAHDLRGPFTGLIGLTEALTENIRQYSQEQLIHFLQQMHTSSEGVYALLTNLLEWSQLERGLIKPEPQTFLLLPMIQLNMKVVAANAVHKQLTLHTLVSEGISVYADTKMVNTVLRNIITNAVKFTPVGGIIEITGQQYDDLVEITIADTGIGIPANGLDKLFRIDAKYSCKGTAGEHGTGLGLILCKELIEKNHGHLRVESEVGKGSRFIVTLPCRDH